MTHASITQGTDANGTVHLTVLGEIDMATSPQLATALQRVIAGNDTTRIAVDLSRLTFLDSTGIRELVMAQALAAEHGITLYVSAAHGHPRRVLDTTGLLAILTDTAPADST